MEVPVRRINKELLLPAYKTAGVAAMDCVVRVETTIVPGKISYAPLNVAMRPPRGHLVLLIARSSLHKSGMTLANNVGIGDEDFCGDNDEYQAALYNLSEVPVTVACGERIVQMLLLLFDRVSWREVETLGAPDRGGFGTTGL